MIDKVIIKWFILSKGLLKRLILLKTKKIISAVLDNPVGLGI